jgi:tRNA 5-methylaminomethyl-2-thiouridine biosynthesis bifunctional protein
LWFGDINELTNELDDSLNQQVDAWFLDGFAPAKNPDMWTPELFAAMARLADPAARWPPSPPPVLSAAACRKPALPCRNARVWPQARNADRRNAKRWRSPRARPGLPAAVRNSAMRRLSAGIASALLALALLRRGWQVTLYCADSAPAEGASGNRQGALYPLLSQHDPALARFFPAAFTFARRLYDALPVMFDHDWCGVTQLGWDTKSAQKIAQMLALNLPPEIAVAVTPEPLRNKPAWKPAAGASPIRRRLAVSAAANR